MAKVTVKINPKNGERTIEVEGVMGGKCTDITAALIAANEHVETQRTGEYCEVEEKPDYIENLDG